MQNESIELTDDVKRSPEVLGPLLSIQCSSLLRWSPTLIQLPLSEKNAIAALHKAGLKGPAITRFRQRGTVER
jgi:hypothetical protein